MFSRFLHNSRLKRPAGVSLLVAIIFVSALMLISLNLAATTITAIKDTRDVNRFADLQNASQSVTNIVMHAIANDYFNHEDPVRGLLVSDGSDASVKAENLSDSDFSTRISKPILKHLQRLKLCQDNSGAISPGKCSFSYSVSSGSSVKSYLQNSPRGTYYSFPGSYFDPTRPDIRIIPSGNAASDCDVDVDGFNGSTWVDYYYLDNPCRWNKLELNELQEIPLYYTNYEHSTINPDSLFTDLLVRIRVPCIIKGQPADWCDASSRPQLYPNDTLDGLARLSTSDDSGTSNLEDGLISTFEYDDTLVFWSIVGQIADRTQFGDVLFPAQGRLKDSINKRAKIDTVEGENTSKKLDLYNSEITASKINKAQAGSLLQNGVPLAKNVLINEKTVGVDTFQQVGSILNFIRNLAPQNSGDANADDSAWDLRGIDNAINKPVLQLMLVKQPRAALDSSVSGRSKGENTWNHLIPYLEYQVLASTPLGDGKVRARTVVQIGDFTREVVTERQHEISQPAFVFESR